MNVLNITGSHINVRNECESVFTDVQISTVTAFSLALPAAIITRGYKTYSESRRVSFSKPSFPTK